MLKGHTKIELTNVNTGKTEVYEKHNLITDGLWRWVNDRNCYESPFTLEDCFTDASGIEPVQTLFGSIFLFDGAMNEDPQDYCFPSDINCVGFAGDFAYQGTMTQRGSREISETNLDYESKKMTFVWNFTTSQGNGTIASLGLSNIETGRMGWDVKADEMDTAITSSKPFFYKSRGEDYDSLADIYLYYDGTFIYGINRNNIRHSSNKTNHVKDIGKIQVMKKYYPTKNFSIFSAPYGSKTCSEIAYEITLPSEIMSIINGGSHSNLRYYIQYDNGYIYFHVNTSGSIAANADFLILRYEVATGNQEILQLKNPANFSLYFGNSGNSSGIMWRSDMSAYILGNKILLSSDQSGYSGWYLLDMTEGTIQAALLNNGKPVGMLGGTKMKLILAFDDYVVFTHTNNNSPDNGQYKTQILNMNTGVGFPIAYWPGDGFYGNSSTNNTSSNRSFIPANYDTIVILYHMYTYNLGTGLNYEKLSARINPFVLMTKNNLEQPIVKTSAQTMKITYTLTEV